MTKVELEMENESLKERVQELEDELDGLEEAYSELECINADLTNSLGNYYISNVDRFISRLRMEDLYTPELEAFMEYYMRYYNDLDLG